MLLKAKFDGHKKIESMNYYEILNIRPNATQKEIEKAYLLRKATYQRDSLATSGLIDDNEREQMLTRIEEAFLTLSSSIKRRAYDSHKLHYKDISVKLASFRKSTKKVLIEDADEGGFWKKLKQKFPAK